MGNAPALAIRGLARQYGEFTALRELSLTVAPGECVAVIGRNGSGKTTAVRMIAGLLEPSAGEIEVAGFSMLDETTAPSARAALAIVPDTPLLYADLTVAEHLELVAIAHGVADDTLADRIDAILQRLSLHERRDARPGALSRGMRQKVQLACALVRPRRLIVLDEPIVGLDPTSQTTLREILAESARDGVAVVMTTHQLEFARGLADRAVLLEDGEMVEDGPYDAVVDGERIQRAGLL